MINKTTYVDDAEKIIHDLTKESISEQNSKMGPRKKRTDEQGIISTSQIRNILSLVNELSDMVRNDRSEELSDDVISHIQYVKMRIIYNAGKADGNGSKQGKSNPVKRFVTESKLIEHLNDINGSREKLLLVCRYTEALVAYHKFYIGGKE